MSEPSPGDATASVILSAATDFGDPNAAAIHILELARGFAAIGCRVALVIPEPSGPQSIIAAGDLPFAVTRFPSLRRWGLPNAGNHLPQLRHVLRAAASFRPDLIYLRGGPGSFITTLGARRLSRSRIVSEHNGWLRDEAEAIGHPRWLCLAVEKAQLIDARAAHAVRVVTPGLGALLAERGIDPAKIFCCGNGTNLEHFRPIPRERALCETGLDPSRRYIGFIGNLAPWQGVPMLVEAFHRIAGQVPDWDLAIAGSGPDLASVRQRIADPGIKNRVRLLGAVPYAQAPSTIACFDIAAAPFGRRRNARIGLSPLKIRDYAASGRPVVAADVPGIRESSDAGWMRLHRADDPDDLARVLMSLIDAPEERYRMAAAARAFAEAHFGWGRVADAILRHHFS